jgi:hypothetical protein
VRDLTCHLAVPGGLRKSVIYKLRITRANEPTLRAAVNPMGRSGVDVSTGIADIVVLEAQL